MIEHPVYFAPLIRDHFFRGKLGSTFDAGQFEYWNAMESATVAAEFRVRHGEPLFLAAPGARLRLPWRLLAASVAGTGAHPARHETDRQIDGSE
jgi:hypothetical protein